LILSQENCSCHKKIIFSYENCSCQKKIVPFTQCFSCHKKWIQENIIKLIYKNKFRSQKRLIIKNYYSYYSKTLCSYIIKTWKFFSPPYIFTRVWSGGRDKNLLEEPCFESRYTVIMFISSNHWMFLKSPSLWLSTKFIYFLSGKSLRNIYNIYQQPM
jgi:hypothetical protein